ncbi:MAG: hypothetical protein CML46_04310 [Rhodobacteraceae bacterium]|nr:hypothetical protein [Paracoccaceae bacterium]MBR26164.1 hypothetical protein [Paracoccaceae bacterium]
MHYDILIEDQSGRIFLENIVPRILTDGQTWCIRSYKGIGHVPKGLRPKHDARKRILLDQLPRLIRGYGKSHSGYGADYPAALIIVCDLDNRDKDDFLTTLLGVLRSCNPAPDTTFCLAIEEGEAWLLGDKTAILEAYPTAIRPILDSYVNDSICGTWELLADAIYKGGSAALKEKGRSEAGIQKCEWAKRISPILRLEDNRSPSFQFFRRTLTADKIDE